MRKGSTPLGSLGVICSGILLLILPLSAVTYGALQAPPAAAQEAPANGATPEAGQPTEGSANAVRDALQQRQSWLERGYSQLASRRRSVKVRRAKSAARPLKVIHTRATWYGPGFHGRRTASGERFNRNAMTLASRHLPFGTRVRVINLKNGKAAMARVNDRGPFRRGYTADLSQGLARRIGMNTSGPVRLEILPKHAK